MEMTPEKLAFIQGGRDQAGEKKSADAVQTLRDTLEVATEDTENEGPPDLQTRSPRKQPKRAATDAPKASDVLDQVLVPVTIRLPHRTAQALRRAYLEQRLRRAQPDTQQKIVEEALGTWLIRQGFLDQ